MAGIPASLLDLNDDVLVTLASYLDSTSALRLSWTSRAIYLITHHLALQSVTLRSALNITKFCSYMLNDMPHRLFALRELHLRCVVLSAYELTAHVTNHTEDFYVAGAKLLSKVFREATNLRVLSMDSADMWMAYETQMISVLSSMRTLQEIELEIIGAHTSEFINTMQSAPRRLFFRKPDRQLESDRRLRLDPQLRLRSVEFLTVNDPDNSPELSDLAQAFPGVKNLIIGESRTHLRAGRRRGTTSIPTALWENLERVRCPPSSFEHWRNIVRIHLLQFIPQLSFALPDVLGGLSIGDIMHIDQIALRVGISAMRNVEPVALIIELDGNLRIMIPVECWTLRVGRPHYAR
ncbi:hypothetical protein EVJ58_g1945 [Rhodofomes roseus]|uniref:F-box domain-containing protein n=1 Tax=Rhodofomes roseus TaxID=34475 RepID=A0A4Y9YSD5_9APHY|nr:hypothetical protein EVJ58_g1945 [Rhodofomes roseus]